MGEVPQAVSSMSSAIASPLAESLSASLDTLRASMEAAFEAHARELRCQIVSQARVSQQSLPTSPVFTDLAREPRSPLRRSNGGAPTGKLVDAEAAVSTHLPNSVTSPNKTVGWASSKKQASLPVPIDKRKLRTPTPAGGWKLDIIQLVSADAETPNQWVPVPPSIRALDWPLSYKEHRDCAMRRLFECGSQTSLAAEMFGDDCGQSATARPSGRKPSRPGLPPDSPPHLAVSDTVATPVRHVIGNMTDSEDDDGEKFSPRRVQVESTASSSWLGGGSEKRLRQDQRSCSKTSARLDIAASPPSGNVRGAWNSSSKAIKRRNSFASAPLSKRKLQAVEADSTFLQKLTQHQSYRILSALLISLNAVFIAWETQHRASAAASDTTVLAIEEEASHFGIVGNLFCFLFVIDLALRMFVERAEFFSSRERGWNIFDIVVVLTSVVEVIVDWLKDSASKSSTVESSIEKLTMLRVVRLLRIVRTSTSFRLIRFIRELRLMVSSLVGSLKSLAWSTVLLLLILLMFGVFFTDGVITYCVYNSVMDDESTYEMRHFFGSLSGSIISLFMAMSGGEDWGRILDSLDALPIEYAYIFLGFITFAVLALGNVITAVFVEAAMQRSQKDREFMIQEEMAQKNEFMQVMQEVFDELDSNQSGALSLEEFERHINDEKIIAYMSQLGLDVSQIRTLFKLLDADRTGEVDLEEFVSGCLRLRGGAKNLDLAILTYQVEFLVDHLKDMAGSSSLDRQRQAPFATP